MSDVKTILQQARELVLNSPEHCVGRFRMWVNERDIRYCALGAIDEAEEGEDGGNIARHLLRVAIGGGSISGWYDSLGPDWRVRCAAAFDRAIQLEVESRALEGGE